VHAYIYRDKCSYVYEYMYVTYHKKINKDRMPEDGGDGN
jgi:hypothetical protein